MRIAAMSDVHGNVYALDAVIADISDRDVDLVVNLGDHLSGGVAPAETADRLLDLAAVSIRGNHERQLLEDDPRTMRLSDRLAHDTISHRHRDWLAGLPARVEVVPGVLAFHGAPDNDLTYLLETVTPERVRPATTAEVRDRLGAVADEFSLLLCGHTHLQRSMRLAPHTLVVNPGSAGWPAYDDDAPYPHVIEAGTPHARYALLDDASGEWECEFRAIEYDWDAAAAVARSNGRADVAHALLTGRVGPSAAT